MNNLLEFGICYKVKKYEDNWASFFMSFLWKQWLQCSHVPLLSPVCHAHCVTKQYFWFEFGCPIYWQDKNPFTLISWVRMFLVKPCFSNNLIIANKVRVKTDDNNNKNDNRLLLHYGGELDSLGSIFFLKVNNFVHSKVQIFHITYYDRLNCVR